MRSGRPSSTTSDLVVTVNPSSLFRYHVMSLHHMYAVPAVSLRLCGKTGLRRGQVSPSEATGWHLPGRFS